MNLDLMERELIAISTIPDHKLTDAEFLRGSLAIGRSGLRDALDTIHVLNRENSELRRAIMGAEPMEDLRHGQFLEMAATLHAAVEGGRKRAEVAERKLAACEADKKEIEMEYSLLYQSSNQERLRLGMHERGHENCIRTIGRLLRLCDDNGLGDKARELMEGIEDA